jgi:hypothetical protein
MARFPKTQRFISQNPRFELNRQSRPAKLSRGEMTVVYKCLAQHPAGLTLKELTQACHKAGYERHFTNPKTDITQSVLYQLNKMDENHQCLK